MAPSRAALLRSASRLAWFTVVWNALECASAIGAAWDAGSRALLGFGADSAVESVAAAVLVWRLRTERHKPERAEQAELRATRLIGWSFALLAFVVGLEAGRSLLSRSEPDVSLLGTVVAFLATLIMPVLGRAKRRVAAGLRSSSVAADSVQTRACAYLSFTVLSGLALNAAFGWWWADPLAAVGVAVFLVAEAVEVLTAARAKGPNVVGSLRPQSLP